MAWFLMAETVFICNGHLWSGCLFEMDTSLKWMPWQSKLKSGTCLTKKEDPTVKAYLTIGHGAAAAVVSVCVTPWTVAHQAPLPVGLFRVRILEWGAISYATGQGESVSPSSWIRILRANYLPTECDADLGLASLTKNQQMNLLELVRKGNRFGKWVMCWCPFLKGGYVCALWKWHIWRFILLRKLFFMFCTSQTFWSGKGGLFFLWPTHQFFLL